MQQQGEASVEEILESIKKVIARDNRADAVQARTRRTIAAEAADTSQPANETDDVLDLGAADFVAETLDNDCEDGDFGGGEPLTAETTRGSMRENFDALAMLSEPGKQPQIVRSGETSLEGMAREMLRPMLAQWLDTNLPPLVEKMVAAEISRIAGKRG